MAVNHHFLVTVTVRVDSENDVAAALELSSASFVMHGERDQVIRAVFDKSAIKFVEFKTELGGKDYQNS